MNLSDRINSVQPSATMAITSRAKALKQEGKDVIALSAGEPDFDAPETARKEGIKAIEESFTHYTVVPGILPLRQAICDRFQEDFHLDYHPDQVVVGCGAKSVLFHLFQVLLNPGDEVIIPAPYWVSSPDQVRLASGTPVILPTQEEKGFVPQADELEKKINAKTRILLINAPSNPSGAILETGDLQALADVLIKNPQVLVLSDEIYGRIVYEGFVQQSLANISKEMKDRTIVINGMSKTYAMTGWRIGYAAGPEKVMQALKKIQGQSTSNASSIAQRASLGALKGDQGIVRSMVESFEKRRNRMLELLNEIPHVSCYKPRGAFYCFPNFSAYFGKKTPSGKQVNDSVELATYLLEEMGVALVPGQPFGAADYLRLSFATSLEEIEKGLDRVRQGLAKMK